MSLLSTEERSLLRDTVMLVTAGFLVADLNTLSESEKGLEAIAFMAKVLRGEDEDEKYERPEGQALDLAAMSHEEILALAVQAHKDPGSVTLNGIRLLASFILSIP